MAEDARRTCVLIAHALRSASSSSADRSEAQGEPGIHASTGVKGGAVVDVARRRGWWASCTASRGREGEAWIPGLRLRFAPAPPGMTKVG